MMKLNLAPERRILLQFAWVAAVAFPLLAGLFTRGEARWFEVWAWNWSHPVVLSLAAVGVVQLLAMLAGVRHLSLALYVLMTLVAFPIGFVLSHVLMALIYYLVMTPIGLAFRVIGRDAMGRKPERERASFWHDRGPARKPSSYFRLY
jgi:hypothetical protein